MVPYLDGWAAIARWKRQVEHVAAQQLGKKRWYAASALRLCGVERAYGIESKSDEIRDGRALFQSNAWWIHRIEAMEQGRNGWANPPLRRL